MTNMLPQIMKWNKLKDYLPLLGYQVENKKKKSNGKIQQCYFITGSWQDVQMVDNNFLALAAAKNTGLES